MEAKAYSGYVYKGSLAHTDPDQARPVVLEGSPNHHP